MRIIFIVISAIAFFLGSALIAAGPGAGFGIWNYDTAFEIYRGAAAPKEIFGGVALSPVFTSGGLSILCSIAAFFLRFHGVALLALIAGLSAVAGGYIPIKMRALAEANPFIHDVTTDFENPPQIVAAANLERSNPAEYVGDTVVGDTGKSVATWQMEAFPDLTPILTETEIDVAAEQVRLTLDEMGLDILAEGAIDSGGISGWRIEAVETSRWFGFKDDLIVRLTPAGDGQTRIDIRSKSRVGGSDLGANANRVQEFRARFLERF